MAGLAKPQAKAGEGRWAGQWLLPLTHIRLQEPPQPTACYHNGGHRSRQDGPGRTGAAAPVSRQGSGTLASRDALGVSQPLTPDVPPISVRVGRVSPERGRWWLEQAASGNDISVLSSLTPVGPLPSAAGEDHSGEFASLWPSWTEAKAKRQYGAVEAAARPTAPRTSSTR